jgi:precorrin-2 dehydrogenase/sirohydrochlorin ferrochelatase
VSLTVTPELFALADDGKITWHKRSYLPSDLNRMFLVISATDNEALNHRISQDAENADKLCNIADRPRACNFILPAIVHRGDLVITVSTSGKSPAFAKKLRQQLESQFGPEYGEFLALMGGIRSRLLSGNHEPEAHKPLFEKIINAGLLDLIREKKQKEVSELLRRVLGDGFEIEALF